MFRTITCKNCGKSEGLMLEIKWEYDSKYCEKCHQTIRFENTYNFCSYKCMKIWIKKAKKCIENDIHEWKPIFDNTEQFKTILKNKEVLIQEKCNICGLTRYVAKRFGKNF